MHCYNDFGTWLRAKFPFRVQKISVDAGFTCPNRDGHIGLGGCIFCDNSTFTPSYCSSGSGTDITRQIEEGKHFFAHKYPDMRYLAYFQSYSNTYASLDLLKRRYEEALSVDGVIGLVIGTRPDCVDEKILDYISDLAGQVFVIIEYGVESTDNLVLKMINRGHSFECANRAIEETSKRGIMVGAHVILGLPGENNKDACIKQAVTMSSTQINLLKIHQLQIVRNTCLATMYANHPFELYTPDEYVKLLAEYLRHLRPDIILDRFTSQVPTEKLIAPRWGLKNHEFANLLENYMQKNKYRQGELYCQQ